VGHQESFESAWVVGIDSQQDGHGAALRKKTNSTRRKGGVFAPFQFVGSAPALGMEQRNVDDPTKQPNHGPWI
jgi:hypothetical protein